MRSDRVNMNPGINPQNAVFCGVHLELVETRLTMNHLSMQIGLINSVSIDQGQTPNTRRS